MTPSDFTAFERRMERAGVMAPAIRAFRRSYEALARDESGLIGEG